MFVDSGNNGAGYIRLYGTYTGSQKMLWLLEIDATGAPGTATWKLAYDGTNFDKETQETFDEAVTSRMKSEDIPEEQAVQEILSSALVMASPPCFLVVCCTQTEVIIKERGDGS